MLLFFSFACMPAPHIWSFRFITMAYAGTTPIEAKELIVLALKTVSMLAQEFPAAELSAYFSSHPLAQHLLTLCVFWLASSAAGDIVRCSLQFSCLLWYVDRWLWSRVVVAYKDTAVLALGGKAVIAKDRDQVLSMALARLVVAIACITAPAVVAAAVGVLTVVSVEDDVLSQASSNPSGFVFILCFYAVLGCTINAVRLALFDANSMLEQTFTSSGVRSANRIHMYQRAPYFSTVPTTLKVIPRRDIKERASAAYSRVKRMLCTILRFCPQKDIITLLFHALVWIKFLVKHMIVKLVQHVVVSILTRSTAETTAMVIQTNKKALTNYLEN